LAIHSEKPPQKSSILHAVGRIPVRLASDTAVVSEDTLVSSYRAVVRPRSIPARRSSASSRVSSQTRKIIVNRNLLAHVPDLHIAKIAHALTYPKDDLEILLSAGATLMLLLAAISRKLWSTFRNPAS
jgi:hypothetical protein